jgi:hypothetical protein
VLAWLAAVPEVQVMADPAAEDYLRPFAWRLRGAGSSMLHMASAAVLVLLCQLCKGRQDLLEQVRCSLCRWC